MSIQLNFVKTTSISQLPSGSTMFDQHFDTTDIIDRFCERITAIYDTSAFFLGEFITVFIYHDDV